MTGKPSTATTNTPATHPSEAQAADQAKALQKRALLADIGGKWGKFDEQELSDLKSGDDLATQVAAKYGIDKAIAQRDVTALLNGRAF
ncbi:MAG TPA: hypothetical protein VLA02_13770 [Reyranella sp.]|nr:hypothetical protein [Reyranella sp.]